MDLTQTYRMQSVKTLYYLVTDGAAEGAILATKNAVGGVPADSVRTHRSHLPGVVPTSKTNLIVFWI